MNYLYLFIIELVFFVHFVANSQPLFPNLPAGEYRVYFKSVMPCKTNQSPELQFNWKLTKTSKNTTELMGNTTFNTPLDDSFSLIANVFVKDSVGGWKDLFQYKFPKACTMLKKMFDPEWSLIFNGHGINNTNCPIPQGVYPLKKGYDLTTIVSTSHLPKIFFYGTYKLRASMNDKFNKEICCVMYMVEVKRPWETI